MSRLASALGLAFLVLVIVPAMALAAHHVNGTWVLEVSLGDGQGGQATFALEEKEEGKLTGTYTGSLGEAEVTGTVDGDGVEFSFDSQAGKITYRGTVSVDTESGGSMEGTCTYGQLSEGTFKGSKKEG